MICCLNIYIRVGGGPSAEGVAGLQGAGLLRAPAPHQLQLAGLTSQQALSLGLGQGTLTGPATNLMAHPLLGLTQNQENDDIT